MVRSRDDATTRSRGRGCQRDETHRGRHLRREIDSTARARGEGSALSERDLTRDRWKPRKRSGRSNDGRGKRSVARDATVFVRVCARSVDANAGGRWTSGHRSMRRSRCVRPCVGKCASCGGKRALSTLFLRVHVHVHSAAVLDCTFVGFCREFGELPIRSDRMDQSIDADDFTRPPVSNSPFQARLKHSE